MKIARSAMYPKKALDEYEHINDERYNVVDFGCGGDAERWIPNSLRIDCNYMVDNINIHYDNINEVPRASCNILTATHVMHYFDLSTFADVLHDFARIVIPGGRVFITCYDSIWSNNDDKEVTRTPAEIHAIYDTAHRKYGEWNMECFAMEFPADVQQNPEDALNQYIVHLVRKATELD